MWRKTKHPANHRRTIPQLEVLETRNLLSAGSDLMAAVNQIPAYGENLYQANLRFGVDSVLIADTYILAANAQLIPQGSAFLAASATYLTLADANLNSASWPLESPPVPDFDAAITDVIQSLNSASLSPAVQTFKTQIEQQQWGPAASTAVQAVAASPLTPLGLNLMSDMLAVNLAEFQDEVDSMETPASGFYFPP
jgi:hypothetical protein